MAFNPNGLSALAYANGFTMWHYRTPDIAGDVDTIGYFNQATAVLRVGDFILANANIGGTVENGVFVVAANVGGVVDVSNITPFGLSNQD